MKAFALSLELVFRVALYLAVMGLMWKHQAEQRQAVRQKAVAHRIPG